MRVKDTKTFIKKARKVHGEERYGYNGVIYIDTGTKVKIFCCKHGIFEQIANDHLNGSGCPPCGYKENGNKFRHDVETFIENARGVHGDKYDYDKVIYIDTRTKVKIFCPKHDCFFEQKPTTHLTGRGCRQCGREKAIKGSTLSQETFISRAEKKHGDKYCYDLVEYKDTKTKIKIQCPEHGPFNQTPKSHLSGKGCPDCGDEKRIISSSLTSEQFKSRASEGHNNRYNYDLVDYKNTYTKVIIQCPDHGPFKQIPSTHLIGSGCPNCGVEKAIVKHTRTLEKFKEMAHKRHNNRYNYDLVDYKGSTIKVIIECPDHGPFNQTPNSHFSGRGCRACSNENHSGGYSKKSALRGDYKGQTINIYFVRLSSEDSNENFYKIGLTNREVKARRPGGSQYNWMNIQTIKNIDKVLAVLFEHYIHRECPDFKEKSYKPQKEFFGQSECYHSLENWDMGKAFEEFNNLN